MRVLIAGVTGYLGSAIAAHLRLHAPYCYIIGCGRKQLNPGNIAFELMDEYVCGDIGSNETIEKIIENPPEIIIYAISLNHNETEINYKLSIDNNFSPLIDLVKRLSDVNEKEIKIIYFSTFQVYGKIGKGAVIDNNTAADAMNMYAFSHYLCELGLEYLSKIRNNISVEVLRLSNGYGMPLDYDCNCWWYVVNDLCKMAVENCEIRMQSDGSPTRDFIDIQDISKAVTTLIGFKDENRFSLDNLASGQACTILDIAFLIKKYFMSEFNKDINIFNKNGELLLRNNFKPSYEVDLSPRMKAILGQTKPIDVGVSDLLGQLVTRREG